MRMLAETGRSFRVERVPLCYMTEYAHCSTETRKIVKSEERIVHFLDNKGTVRQTEWGHLYAEVCEGCSVRSICGVGKKSSVFGLRSACATAPILTAPGI